MKFLTGCCLLVLLVQESFGFAAYSRKHQDDPETVATKKELDEEIELLVQRLISEVKEMKAEEKQTNDRDAMLERATKEVIEDQRERSLKELNQDSSSNLLSTRLSKFLKSTPYIKKVAVRAKVQLKALEEYKRTVWDKKRQVGATTADFLREAREVFGGSILKRSFIAPSLLNVPSSESLDTCIFNSDNINCNNVDDSFRTIDGTCNNLKNDSTKYWGSANRVQIRLVAADYGGDGLGTTPRTQGVNGNVLPSARTVSKTILQIPNPPDDPRNSYLTMVFGQFLDHDITHTPAVSSCTNCQSSDICFPILTPGESRTCMDFGRSEGFMDENCAIAVKTPANTITAWIDASQVYDSNRTLTNDLYDSSTGKMITQPSPQGGGDLLPSQTDAACISNDPNTNDNIVPTCFLAGDVRQNEQTSLAAMHTIFMRYHNFIVDQFVTYDLSGEEKFQLARQILGGVWQHLVFDEYLPVILSRDAMSVNAGGDTFDLTSIPRNQQSFFTGHDENVTPDVDISFSTAAMRFGHTEIKSNMPYTNGFTSSEDTLPLHNILFNTTSIFYPPGGITTSGIEAVLTGLMITRVSGWDRFFSSEITEHLFQGAGETIGLDLPALNIQRGRDHGMAGYVNYRFWCNLDTTKITSYQQLRATGDFDQRDIPGTQPRRDILQVLESLYPNVEDIDLFAAGISELKLNGAQVGRTFSCLLGHQFGRMKYGDSFFYENENGPFTQNELNQIKTASLARVLCDTMVGVTNMPQRPLLVSPQQDGTNTPVSCDTIGQMDFTEFATARGFSLLNNNGGNNNNGGSGGNNNGGSNNGGSGGGNNNGGSGNNNGGGGNNNGGSGGGNNNGGSGGGNNNGGSGGGNNNGGSGGGGPPPPGRK